MGGRLEEGVFLLAGDCVVPECCVVGVGVTLPLRLSTIRSFQLNHSITSLILMVNLRRIHLNANNKNNYQTILHIGNKIDMNPINSIIMRC